MIESIKKKVKYLNDNWSTISKITGAMLALILLLLFLGTVLNYQT